ncbi:aquaporin-7-like isoform X1 [Argiope bruennichi]|uniref:aquaporin-7-like isoform X1 n=1 Tax=Argiope bruennichi TaxID=94029 RepID=UPI002494DAF5|nr:aquaporin-7-like isoform X1 [Argiope bruennichi]
MASPPGILKKFRTRSPAVREFLSEFFGTFILIIYGNAAFASTILEGKGVPDVFGVTWAWGVGVILGITISGGVSGGHINPGVTVGFAAVGKFPWRKVPIYLLAQHLGGFFASVVLYFTFFDAFNNFDPEGTVIGETRSAWVFATYPREGIAIWNCFFGEIVAGGLLMFTVMGIVDSKNLNIPKYLWPVFIGFMIQVTAQVFGLNCMAPINPARDFPTRVFTAIAGWGAETFSIRNYGYWWIGIVGPHVGCIIGAWFYYLAIELHWPEEKEIEDGDIPLSIEAKGRNRRDV